MSGSSNYEEDQGFRNDNHHERRQRKPKKTWLDEFIRSDMQVTTRNSTFMLVRDWIREEVGLDLVRLV